jgi:hypothetical protein
LFASKIWRNYLPFSCLITSIGRSWEFLLSSELRLGTFP